MGKEKSSRPTKLPAEALLAGASHKYRMNGKAQTCGHRHVPGRRVAVLQSEERSEGERSRADEGEGYRRDARCQHRAAVSQRSSFPARLGSDVAEQLAVGLTAERASAKRSDSHTAKEACSARASAL